MTQPSVPWCCHSCIKAVQKLIDAGQANTLSDFFSKNMKQDLDAPMGNMETRMYDFNKFMAGLPRLNKPAGRETTSIGAAWIDQEKIQGKMFKENILEANEKKTRSRGRTAEAKKRQSERGPKTPKGSATDAR